MKLINFFSSMKEDLKDAPKEIKQDFNNLLKYFDSNSGWNQVWRYTHSASDEDINDKIAKDLDMNKDVKNWEADENCIYIKGDASKTFESKYRDVFILLKSNLEVKISKLLEDNGFISYSQDPKNYKFSFVTKEGSERHIVGITEGIAKKIVGVLNGNGYHASIPDTKKNVNLVRIQELIEDKEGNWFDSSTQYFASNYKSGNREFNVGDWFTNSRGENPDYKIEYIGKYASVKKKMLDLKSKFPNRINYLEGGDSFDAMKDLDSVDKKSTLVIYFFPDYVSDDGQIQEHYEVKDAKSLLTPYSGNIHQSIINDKVMKSISDLNKGADLDTKIDFLIAVAGELNLLSDWSSNGEPYWEGSRLEYLKKGYY